MKKIICFIALMMLSVSLYANCKPIWELPTGATINVCVYRNLYCVSVGSGNEKYSAAYCEDISVVEDQDDEKPEDDILPEDATGDGKIH